MRFHYRERISTSPDPWRIVSASIVKYMRKQPCLAGRQEEEDDDEEERQIDNIVTSGVDKGHVGIRWKECAFKASHGLRSGANLEAAMSTNQRIRRTSCQLLET